MKTRSNQRKLLKRPPLEIDFVYGRIQKIFQSDQSSILGVTAFKDFWKFSLTCRIFHDTTTTTTANCRIFHDMTAKCKK